LIGKASHNHRDAGFVGLSLLFWAGLLPLGLSEVALFDFNTFDLLMGRVMPGISANSPYMLASEIPFFVISIT
jgi:hypothetical protein